MRYQRLLVAVVAMLLAADPASSSPARPWLTRPAPVALPPAVTDAFVDHDGARIHYAAFGSGPPVIMLHGGLASMRYWGDQVPALIRAGFRPVLIDSRGHGRSTRDGRPYTYELMASDVLSVMDALKIRRTAIVGWSDVAIIGLVMAMRSPDRVSRVFAFAANMDPSGVKADVETNPVFAGFEKQAAIDYASISPTPQGFESFKAAINRMWATEPNYKPGDLSRIRVPVTIADGDHDEAIKREHTEYLARSIPGARLVILPGVSHFAMLQDPPLFNKAVLSFLGDGAGMNAAH